MNLKVIGAGFGRTGTMSLKAALEELDSGPCYHMSEVFENPSHPDLWNAAANGERVDWEELLGDYAATVDWPGCSFYEELMAVYPEAKVLLSVRDPVRWYESVSSTIYNIRRITASSKFFAAIGKLNPRITRITRMVNNLIWDGAFDGRFEDKQYAIEVFERHNEKVKERVPKDRLLVYEVREGWGPLCEFLGVEVPDAPFPHLNDADSFRKMLVRRIALAAAVPAFALGFLVFWMVRRLRKKA